MCDVLLKSGHYTQSNTPLYAIARVGFLCRTLFTKLDQVCDHSRKPMYGLCWAFRVYL